MFKAAAFSITIGILPMVFVATSADAAELDAEGRVVHEQTMRRAAPAPQPESVPMESDELTWREQTPVVNSRSEKKSYTSPGEWGPLVKLSRGGSNLLGSIFEIPLGVQRQKAATEDKVTNFFVGLGTGFLKGFQRFAVGAYEVVTFPIPLPEHYQPILPTLTYFDRHENPGFKDRPMR